MFKKRLEKLKDGKRYKASQAQSKAMARCKEVNLPYGYFQNYVEDKGLNPVSDLTDELVEEFFSRPHLLYKLNIPVEVTLPETVYEIHGYTLYGSGQTKTSKKRLRVKSDLYIPDNGLVFKKALNKSEDMRLAWDTITDVSLADKKSVLVTCDTVSYKVLFNKKEVANLFLNIVNENKCGKVDDGWE